MWGTNNKSAALNQGSKIAKAARDICVVQREGVIIERIAQDQYAKFKKGNFEQTGNWPKK